MWIKAQNGSLYNVDNVQEIRNEYDCWKNEAYLCLYNDGERIGCLCARENGYFTEDEMDKISEAIKNGEKFLDFSE